MSKISVRNVQQTGNHFSADVTITDTILDEHKTYFVETSNHGDGLWIDGQQVTGTCQFGAQNKNQFRMALYRWFRD